MHETVTSIMKACTHLYEYVSELKDIEVLLAIDKQE